MEVGLGHLAIIWAGVFVAVTAARRTRRTHTGLLPAESDDFIRGFAELGIILIMFALGFEANSAHFPDSIRKSWGIAFFGAVAPFLAAYGVAHCFWRDADVALMCGLAMTASAVSLTMVSLRSGGLSASPVKG